MKKKILTGILSLSMVSIFAFSSTPANVDASTHPVCEVPCLKHPIL